MHPKCQLSHSNVWLSFDRKLWTSKTVTIVALGIPFQCQSKLNWSHVLPLPTTVSHHGEWQSIMLIIEGKPSFSTHMFPLTCQRRNFLFSLSLFLDNSNTQFRAVCQVDAHQTQDYSFGMVYVAMCQLDEAVIDKETVTEFTKCEHGILGVKGFDALGTGRRIVIGKQNLHNKSGIPRTPRDDDLRYRGKLHSDLLSVMILFCSKVSFTLTEGHVTIEKEQIKSDMRPLLDSLIDFQYRNLCINSWGPDVFEHASARIQDMIIQVSWLLRGFVNRHPEFPLAPYEGEQCFVTTRDDFLKKHFLRVCDCSSPCRLQSTILTVYGCLLEIVRNARRELVPTLTLQDLVGWSNCLDFVSRFTRKVALNQFRVIGSVPRYVERSSTEEGMNIRVFTNDILTRDELLTPRPVRRIVPRYQAVETSVLNYDSAEDAILSDDDDVSQVDYDIPTTMCFRPK